MSDSDSVIENLWPFFVSGIIAIIFLTNEELMLVGLIPLVIALYFGYKLALGVKEFLGYVEIGKKKQKTKNKKMEKIEEKQNKEMISGIKDILYGIGGIIAIFLVVIGVVMIAVEVIKGFEEPQENYIDVGEFKIIIPEGWSVETHTSDGFLLSSEGSLEGESRANFNISQEYSPLSFPEVTEEGKNTLIEFGTNIESERKRIIQGKDTKEFVFTGLGDSGAKMKGKQIYINRTFGKSMIITFSSKESTYSKNVQLFEKSLNSIQFK